MRDYTKYDYQALIDRMTDLLKDKEGWGDAYQSSTGQMLIQLMADVTDHLHYMLERRTLEGFLELAKLRTSVIARASEMGYRMRRIRSHKGYVRVTLLDSSGDPTTAVGEVSIPERTVLTAGERSFFTLEAATIHYGESSVDLYVKEGVLESKEFNVDAGDVVFDDFSNIDHDAFYVFDDGEEYRDVTTVDEARRRALSFALDTDAMFDIKYEVNGMRVVFGDGVFGKKPEGNVTVTYARVDDLNDPMLVVPTEFRFTSHQLADFQEPTVKYDYSAVSITAINGGTEEESLDSIKENAVLYHKSNTRAVTNDDYSYWVKESGIGDIVDVKTFGEEEIESLVYNANNVYVTYATSLGNKLSAQDHIAIRAYLDKIKTSQAHIVLNQAKNIFVRLTAEIKKTKNIPISNAQAYRMVYEFLEERFRVKSGTIGGTFHLSDLVDELYDIQLDRNGVKYPLVDYVKISSDTVVPFDYPPKTGECFITIDPAYVPTNGDQFVVSLENMVCLTNVESTQTLEEILLAMRDVVAELTPFEAKVHIKGIALDAFGNPIPIEISPKVGYHLLIGYDTPFLSSTELVTPAVIGSAIIGVAATSPALTVNHFYYSSPAGRRPMIPLRVGTTVSMTAPTDTDVRVYVRDNATLATTETQLQTITAGSPFSMIITDKHALIFEYVNDSSEDVIVTIEYPDYEGIQYGLRVKSVDKFGTFKVTTTSGDLAPFVSTAVDIALPTPDYSSVVGTDGYILPKSLRITDSMANPLVIDDGIGNFVDAYSGVLSTGRITYKTGKVTLPSTLPPVSPAGKYLIVYDQDRFENLSVGSSDVIRLILPKPTAESGESSITTLVVK